MTDSAVLRLAQIREKYYPDADGRIEAAEALFGRLMEAAKTAGLHVEPDRGTHRLSLAFPPEIQLAVSPVYEGFQIGEGSRAVVVQGIEYDPVGKQFIGSDGTDALDLVVKEVFTALDAKGSEVRNKRRRPNPEDDEEYQEAFASSINSRGGF